MAKKAQKRKQNETPAVKVDNFARVLQIVAIAGVVAIVIVDSITPNTDVPVYIPAGLMGVAIGLSPEQFINLIRAIFTARGK